MTFLGNKIYTKRFILGGSILISNMITINKKIFIKATKNKRF